MSFLDDILNLFNSGNSREEHEQIQEDWVRMNDDLSTFGGAIADFLDDVAMDRENEVNSYRALMAELRDQSRQRVEQSRQRVQETHHRVRRRYRRQIDQDLVRMHQLMHQSMEELMTGEKVQPLEKVNWKQEGF